MHVKNAVYKEIKPGWKGITLPLKAGTPMNAAGQIVNGAGAIGIVPQTIAVKPVTPTINLLVGGSVSLAEVNAAYGSALTKAAKESMNGIAFFGEDGTPEPDPIWKGETIPGTLPAVTSTDNGKTLVVTEGVWAVGGGGGGGGGGVLVVHEDSDTGSLDKTWQEIHDALAAETPVFLAYTSSMAASMKVIADAVSGIGYQIFLQGSEYAFAQAESADGYPLDLDF